MELDLWCPNLNLAFEYQGTQEFLSGVLQFLKGEQHYHNFDFQSHSRSPSKRDNTKLLKCQEMSITLVQIPYWWDGKKDTLQQILIDAGELEDKVSSQ